jgi:hypothetical protein
MTRCEGDFSLFLAPVSHHCLCGILWKGYDHGLVGRSVTISHTPEKPNARPRAPPPEEGSKSLGSEPCLVFCHNGGIFYFWPLSL